jgi:hypothetical protein
LVGDEINDRRRDGGPQVDAFEIAEEKLNA